MSAGLFSKALKGAGFSVTTSKEGIRSFKSQHDDRSNDSSGGGGGKAPRKPWRGGGRGGNRGSNRGYRGGGRSRGNYRGRGRGSKYQSSAESQSEETNDEDGDVNMEDYGQQTFNNRYKPYGSRPSYRQTGNKFQSSNNTWNKITIQNGKKHDKEWLLKRLRTLCEVSFEPVEFHFSQENANFFVDNQRAADALRAVSGSITVRDGSKLFINIRSCPPPKRTGGGGGGYGGGGYGGGGAAGGGTSSSDNIDEEVLKRSLDARYDSTTHSLDLSNFYHDKVLIENQYQGILGRTWLMGKIVDLIKDYCSQLQTLDLRENRILNLDGLGCLNDAAPQLTTLHLGGNNIRHIAELRKIKNLKQLTTLVIDGNPLCNNYNDSQTSYVSDIRGIFPKLVMLDNCELPAHIGFDLPSLTSLPETKGSFIPNELKDTLVPFIKQYFQVYDSDNRQKLLDAYDEDAVFSLCVADHRKDRGNGPLNVYRKYSRNMKFLHDTPRRLDLLKTSKLAVVAFLTELPSTKHDLESLTVDVNMVKPTCIGFTVEGVFKEGESQDLRAFTRVFMAVPAAGNSIAIINDHVSIRSPTPARRESQKSAGFQQPTPSEPVNLFPPQPNIVNTTPQAKIATPQLTTPTVTSNLTPQQQRMIQVFSSQSGMNMTWSFKALSENGWDYQKSADVFKSLQSQGSIPQEAFAK